MRSMLLVGLVMMVSVGSLQAKMDLPLMGGDSGFELSGSIGYASVSADELVFDQGRTLSELNWSSTILLGSITAGWRIGKVKVAGTYGLSLGSLDGELVDYDWMIDMPMWTDRSIGDAAVDLSRLDIRLSYDLFKVESAVLSVLIGYKIENWYWEDDGGSYIYSIYGFRDSEGEFEDGTGIEYDQDFRVPYLGFEAFCPVGLISLSGYFHYSPIASVVAEDTHIFTDASSEDTIDVISYIAFGVSGQIPLTGSSYVALNVDYLTMPEEKGDLELLVTGEVFDDAAGVEVGMTSVSLVLGTVF